MDLLNSSGGLRGYKGDVYEGGIRVPTVARWTGRITPDTFSDHPASSWDLFPTLCELAGLEIPEGLDGISFLPSLTGRSQNAPKFLYWEKLQSEVSTQAVRRGPWKLVYREGNPLELYRLDQTAGEATNLAHAFPEMVGALAAIMREQHEPNTNYPFRPYR